MFVYDYSKAKDLCSKIFETEITRVNTDNCHVDATEPVYHSGTDISRENTTIAVLRASGLWGKGDGRRSQASAACRHSHLRQPSKKNINYLT